VVQPESLIIENNVPVLSNVDEIITSDGNAQGTILPMAQSGNFVASKNSKYYYLPTCATVKRIKDENKIWFQTEKEAQSAGFTRGSGCFE
jgi:methylphosphotriester-DNA--protein-cysteine methyltransferase